MTLLDAKDKVIWNTAFTGSMGGGIGSQGAIFPLRLRLSTPTRTKQMDIPFELKDLPLP